MVFGIAVSSQSGFIPFKNGHASLRSTTSEVLLSEESEFYQDKPCMPDPRQQDRKLNRDELVTYRYPVVLVEVQSGEALQLAQHLC